MIVSPQPPCHNRLESLNSFSVSLLVKLGRLGDDRVVQQDGDGSELDCPQRQAGNSHWRAFSYSGTSTPLIRLPRNAGHTGRMDDANHTQPLAAELSGQDRATFIRGRTYPSTEPIVSSGEVAHPSRCTNLATSMTT